MPEIIFANLTDLPTIAQKVLEYAGTRQKWMLHGDMGAGKTTFVRALCANLGTDEVASSPTYSLVNEYVYPDKNGQPALIHHLDLYRLHDIDEALDMGIETYLDDPNLCIIEWPQLIQPLWPDDALHIHLTLENNEQRKIVFL